MSSHAFLTRVVVKNYKSIALCEVAPGPLTFLVGPNGAGKSNFLDALRFVADALRTTLDHAIRDRGGLNEVRRRSSGHPTHFGIRLDFSLPDKSTGHHAFEVAARPNGGYVVKTEECEVFQDGLGRHAYRVCEGTLAPETTAQVPPPATSDRLYLVNAAGLPEFRPVYDAISHMGFYGLNPAAIRDLQPPDAGSLLQRDGGNLASVLARLTREDIAAKQRIQEYLALIVPGVERVDHKTVGPMETIEFRQRVAGAKDPWRFPAASMSDGTLRALGILVALFQRGNGAAQPVPLVAIEEPEIALHPAAAGVLRDCLRDASRETQVFVTSHSPDLLDDPEIDGGSIRAVTAEEGITHIAPLDEASRSVLRDRLYTPGELLRLNQLVPDPASIGQSQLALFGNDDHD